MKVLILGSGGREHAFAWKIAQSPLCEGIYTAPGNAGTALIGTNLPIALDDFQGLKKAVLEHGIGLVVAGSEEPLVKGVHDFFLSDPDLRSIPVFGPQKLGATLEGSKEFAKAFMMRHNIPTAAYMSFTKDNLEQGYAFLDALEPPFVLKADGLAAGKGVLIIQDRDQAKAELRGMIQDKKFGDASDKVVIEEFLSGIECSVFVITDGKSYKILPEAKDYKRIGEGDTGLNTGGMGAVSPVPFVDEVFMKKVEERIIAPTVAGLATDGIPYTGFIFFGLIKVKDEPMVIEYNVRMGDPETEAVIPRIESDFLEAIYAATQGNLSSVDFKIDPRAAVTVVMVSGGYPEHYEKGKVVTGIEQVQESIVFHAGTASGTHGSILTSGGRVLTVTSFGDDFKKALEKSYRSIEKIKFEKAYFRGDIGRDLFTS